MKINKIQILIPAGGFYGGIESLHQAAHLFNKLNVNAEIVYIPTHSIFGFKKKNHKNTNLKNYNIKIAKFFDDSENVLFIIPETFTGYTNILKKGVIAIWWLSVDNYFKKKKNEIKILTNLLDKYYKITKSKKFAHYLKQISLKDLKKKKIFHFAQSDYAKKFLENNKFSNIILLKDYIHIRTNYRNSIKKYDVLLNYQKGNNENLKFINSYKDVLKIINLKDFDLKTSQKKISESKLFVDFGNHPGRDRIPREAVLLKSNILINKKGAAEKFSDVPLKNKFKFKEINISTYFTIIQSILLYGKKFQHLNYFKKINNDKQKMKIQLKRLLKIINYES